MLRRNDSMESGRHGAGTGLNAHAGSGPKGKQKATPLQQSPVTGAKPEYNGLHPERVKELQNEGERQAKQQIEQPSAPFGKGSMMDDMPEELGEDTLPVNHPPTGEKHQNVTRQLPNMAAAHKGHIPKANVPLGGMKPNVRRGGKNSAFYGD